MLNYIKSELYKTLHRKYFYLLILVGCGLCVGVNLIVLWMAREGIANGPDAAFSLEMIGSMMLGVTFVCPMMITDVVFSEEYKHQTMKNTVSYGFSRTEIFFGKFFAELIVAIVSIAFILAAFVGSAFVLGAPDGQETALAVERFFVRVLLLLPLWVWVLALSHTVVFFVKNNTFFALVSVGITYVLPLIFNQYMVYPWPELVAAVSPYLAFTKMQQLTSNSFAVGNLGMMALDYWGTGLLRAVAALAVGAALFKRREIK